MTKNDLKGGAGSDVGELLFPNPVYAWYVVIIFTIAYGIGFVDRQILNLMVDPIRTDLQISDTAMSLLQGFSFVIFYVLMGIPIGRMVDRYNRCAIITLGIFFWSIMTAMCGLARNYWQLFFARIGVGVGEAALSPAVYSIVADYFPPQRLAFALGIYGVGLFLGVGLAMIGGGALIGAIGETGSVAVPLLGEIRTWQLVFVLASLPGLILVLLMATVREPARRGAIRARTVNGVKKTQSIPVREILAYFRANWRTVVLHHGAAGGVAMCLYSTMAWIPAFFGRIHGFDVAKIGLYYGTNILIFGTLGVVCGGWLSDRMLANGVRDAKIRIGLYATLGAILPLAAFPLVESPTWALILMAPATFFMTFALGAMAAAVLEIMPNQMRGQASAIYMFVTNLIAMGVGPTSVALVTDYVFGYDEAVRYSLAIVPAVAMAMSTILFAFCLKPYRDSLDYLKAYLSVNN